MTSELDRLSLALPNVAPGGMKLVSECKAAGPGLGPCPQAYKSLSQTHPSMSCRDTDPCLSLISVCAQMFVIPTLRILESLC